MLACILLLFNGAHTSKLCTLQALLIASLPAAGHHAGSDNEADLCKAQCFLWCPCAAKGNLIVSIVTRLHSMRDPQEICRECDFKRFLIYMALGCGF